MIVRCCLAVLSTLSGTLWGADSADPPAPPETNDIEGYEIRRIEGWRVIVSAAFLRDEPALAGDTLDVLEHQLFQIRRMVPAAAVEKIRQVAVWVEEKEPHHACMAYHPSAGWLREHGMEPRKARCIEIANARNYLAWTRDQPWMVLHELAHAYHDQFLGGYGNPEIAAAYRRAMDAKRYDAVLHASGRTQRAYAASNPMEYFAEASEAFFGANDFYPFVRAELRAHDPKLFALLETLWGRSPGDASSPRRTRRPRGSDSGGGEPRPAVRTTSPSSSRRSIGAEAREPDRIQASNAGAILEIMVPPRARRLEPAFNRGPAG